MAPKGSSSYAINPISKSTQFFLKSDSVHYVLRGWWGNPWVFESPLRHHLDN